MLVTVSFGPAAPAVAQDSTTATEIERAAPVYQPIDIDGLEGFQLPTSDLGRVRGRPRLVLLARHSGGYA